MPRSLKAGSPPRVRGEGCATRLPCALWRITPACAGRRNVTRVLGLLGMDHPRVCGEKDGAYEMIEPGAGSPPRVRGEGSAR